MDFLVKFLVVVIGIYLLIMYFIIIGFWKYSLYKENKTGGFGRYSNHLNYFKINVDSYQKTLLGYKIDGELRGVKPLLSNVVYYHNEQSSKAVIAYGVKGNYIKIYGLPANMISTNSYVDNVRPLENSHLMKIEDIHYPVIFKASLKYLGVGIFLLLGGLIFLYFVFNVHDIELYESILLSFLCAFSLGASYLLITTFFKNRGVLNENCILKIHHKKYHIEDLKYELITVNQQYQLIIKDANNKQIVFLAEEDKGFKECYCLVDYIEKKRRKQELYQKIYQTTFYIPLSENSYYIHDDQGFVDLIAYESLKELEQRVPQAAGDEMTNIEEMVKITEDFTVINQIILLFEDGISYGVSKNNWQEICDAKELM